MESKGKIPVSSWGHSKVSTPHTVEEEEYTFPLEGFPYMGSIPINFYRDFSPNYVTSAQLVSGTPSTSSLYHNHVWAFCTMPITVMFIQNLTFQQTVISIVTSVPVQPTILNPLVLSVQVTYLAQLTSRVMSL